MRVLICGDRDWNDYELIEEIVELVNAEFPISTIIEGECRGADTFGRTAGEVLGISVDPYPADWDGKGKAAGMIRNHQMLVEGSPDLVLAFHEDFASSKGTKNMMEISMKAGVSGIVITHDTPKDLIVEIIRGLLNG